jgi:hypothetical protein
MATFSDNKRRGRFERPDYAPDSPERHARHEEVGTTKEGVPIHGSYRQPFVEVDGVKADPTSQIDGDGKDVG